MIILIKMVQLKIYFVARSRKYQQAHRQDHSTRLSYNNWLAFENWQALHTQTQHEHTQAYGAKAQRVPAPSDHFTQPNDGERTRSHTNATFLYRRENSYKNTVSLEPLARNERLLNADIAMDKLYK